MKDFIKNPITITELMIWKRNKSINPRSKKSLILKSGKHNQVFNYIETKYNEVFPKGYDIFDSVDFRDPITLNIFYEEDQLNPNNKTLIYDEIENLILYEEINTRNNQKLIRCFEKESLSYMKTFNMLEHPVSKLKIPDDILNCIETSKIDNSKLTVEERSLQVFQKFTNISFGILTGDIKFNPEADVIKLNYEIKDFYIQNFSAEDRDLLESKFLEQNEYIENNRKLFFTLNKNDFSSKDLKFIQFYILDQLELLIDCKIDHLKYMANYIALGGLSLVIEEVKEMYENFQFNF